MTGFTEKFQGLRPTKRNVLSAISQIFDPIGLLSPVFISIKIFMQKIHKTVKDWDSEVSGSLEKEWREWILLLQNFRSIEIERCYLRDLCSDDRFELHGFSSVKP